MVSRRASSSCSGRAHERAHAHFKDGVLFRVPNVDRLRVVRLHQSDEARHEVVHVLERARLRAGPVDGDVLALERLHDKVGHDAAVVARHARAVGVEDARHPHVHVVLALVAVRQRLCGVGFAWVTVAGVRGSPRVSAPRCLAAAAAPSRTCDALALVVARTHADWVDVAPVLLVLRMDLGIAVDLCGPRAVTRRVAGSGA